MSDLSNLLGDVYGDHSPDAAPVRRELPADQRAPEWAAESQLDRAFEGWVPGEPPAASRPEDLTAALAAALAVPAPAAPAAPAPARPVQASVPLPTFASAPVAPAAAPAPAAWTTSASPAPPAPTPAPAVVAAPLAPWRPGDDDIFPMGKFGRKGKQK